MTFTDLLALIVGAITIISVSLNIIQLIKRREMVRTLKSRSQASYNYFYRIAKWSDSIRGLREAQKEDSEKILIAVRSAHAITGTVDAARLDIASYSREHLNFVPVREHPGTPLQVTLPKPRKVSKKASPEKLNQEEINEKGG